MGIWSKKENAPKENEKANVEDLPENHAEDVTEEAPVEDQSEANKTDAPETEEKAEETVAPEVAELALLKDRYTRLLADFDNFRKRQIREREEQAKRANERLLKDLLPVVDHLELTLSKVNPEDPIVVGVQMIYDSFINVLAQYGLKPIDAKGTTFDPAIHEALTMIPSETVPAHTVVDQFRRGWTLGDYLVRPAQVVVSSGAPESDAQQDEAPPAEEEKPADNA